MAIHKISTVDMSREDWLAERKNSLGGSDIGSILGLNPYRTPYSVWAEKTGRIPEPSDNEAMRQGRDLEEYVAQRFTEKSGLAVRRVNAIIRNDDFPHVHANIDRAIVGQKSGLECKTASALSCSKFTTGEFPLTYYAQSVTYMGVCEFERYYLAVLILGKEFKIYQLTRIENDTCPEWCESSVFVPQEEIEALKGAAVEFWQYVKTDTAPQVDGKEPTTEALKTIYKGGKDEPAIELFGRESLLDNLDSLNLEKKAIEERIEALKQTLMLDLGDFEMGIVGERKVTWKIQSRSTFDKAAFEKAHPEIKLSNFYKKSQFRALRIY